MQRSPNKVNVDLIIVVPQHAAEPPQLRKLHVRVFLVQRGTDLPSGFRYPLQAPLDGILCLLICGISVGIDIRNVASDARDIVHNLA